MSQTRTLRKKNIALLVNDAVYHVTYLKKCPMKVSGIFSGQREIWRQNVEPKRL